MTRSNVVRAALATAIGFFVVIGAWAFASPKNFYDVLAEYPPLNAHFLRDVGAFNLGIGAGLLASLRWKDAVVASLGGASAASVMHAVSHIIDRDAGGKATDAPLLWLLAVVIVAGFVARLKEVS